MRNLRLVIIALIIFGEGCFFFAQLGKHAPLYYLQLTNLRKAELLIAIGILLTCIYKGSTKSEKVVVVMGMVFCFMTAMVQLYCFLPVSATVNYQLLLINYYYIWRAVSVALFLYIAFIRFTNK